MSSGLVQQCRRFRTDTVAAGLCSSYLRRLWQQRKRRHDAGQVVEGDIRPQLVACSVSYSVFEACRVQVQQK